MKVEPVAYTHESYLHPATLHFEAMKKPHPSFPVPLYAIPPGYALVRVEQVKDAERLRNEREQLNAQLRKLGADAMANLIDCEHEKLPATRVKRLVAQYGSYRAVGEVLGIDHAYLNRIANGEKDNMSDDVLRKLGLRRLFYYAAIDAAITAAKGE